MTVAIDAAIATLDLSTSSFSTSQQQAIKDLKLLAPKLAPLSGQPLHRVQLALADALTTPHTFAAHAQLKQCVVATTDESGKAATLRVALAIRLDERLTCRQSLWPDDAGALRSNGSSMPGWLQLMIDVPAAAPLVRHSGPRLLELLATSLRDARSALAYDPAAVAASAASLELSKVILLVLRSLKPSLTTRGVTARIAQEMADGYALVAFPSPDAEAADDSEPEASPVSRAPPGSSATTTEALALAAMAESEAAAAATAANSESADAAAERADWPEQAVDRLVETLRSICRAALRVLLLHGVAADTALAASHLLCAAFDVLLPSSIAAHHVLMLLECARAVGESVHGVALRGAVQGASIATLSAPLTSEAAQVNAGSDYLRNGAGATAGDMCGGWPEGLLFGSVGSGIVSACAQACDATFKLSSFRALEALLTHIEAAAPPSMASAEVERALRSFLSSAVQLLFDHWELSFQSLTSMLMPLLRRLLVLLAAAPSFAAALEPPSATPGWFRWLLPRLRQMDWTRRAKYRTLQATVGVLPEGARALLAEWPDLLPELFASLHIPNYANLASELLMDVMRSLEHQLQGGEAADAQANGEAAGGQAGGAGAVDVREVWMRLVIMPLLASLNGVSATQTESILHACLPAVLTAQPAALGWLLEHARGGSPSAGATARAASSSGTAAPRQQASGTGLTMAVLKVARDLGLLSGEALFTHAALLTRALEAADEQVAHDALHVLCITHKQTEPASALELSLLRGFWPSRIKGASPHARKQLANAMRRLLQRLKRSTFGSARDLRDLEQLRVDAAARRPVTARLQPAADKRDYAQAVADWLAWLCTLLEQQLYPGVPITRALLALELYEIFVETWAPAAPDSSAGSGSGGARAEVADDPAASLACLARSGFEPSSLFGAPFASRLLQLLLQDFEVVRAAAFARLARFPAGPLPGLATAAQVAALAHAAIPLVLSPRVYESDAGAAILRLLAHRYVSQLGWTVRLSTRGSTRAVGELPLQVAIGEGQTEARAHAIDAYVGCLLDVLDEASAAVGQGARDELHMHGILATLRLAAEDAEAAGAACASAWRDKLPGLLSTAQRICHASATVLCEGNDVVDGGGGSVPDFLGDNPDEEEEEQEVDEPSAESMTDATPAQATLNREGRLRIVVNWMALKEASLAVGSLVRLALPSAGGRAAAAPAKRRRPAAGGLASAAVAAPLSRDELDAAGRTLLRLLMRTRHTGVIERASLALSEVSERLLGCGEPTLASLPSEWLAELLSGGTSVTYLRRSAGLPHAVLAVLHAERSSGGAQAGGGMFASCMGSLLHGAHHGAEASCAPPSADSSDWLPRVHALNLVRLIFLDKAFGLPILAHVSAGFIAAFSALSATEWAVRNSGLLLLAALLQRALRQSRTRDAHANQADDANGIGIRDFFSRAPEVRPYLITSLDATLHGSISSTDGIERPELYPMLLLLSRLVPSPTTDVDGRTSAIDLSPLVPLVCECGAMPSLRVRAIAADALVPLVDTSELPRFLPALANELLEPGLPTNRIHGTLLQLKALAGAAIARSVTLVQRSADVAAWCGATLEALQPSFGLLEAICPAVCIAFVQLLAVLTPHAPPAAIGPAAAAAISAAERDGSSLGNATWRAELCALAVRLCYREVLGSRQSGAPSAVMGEALLLRMLSSPAYEARLAGVLAARQLLGLDMSEARDVDDGLPTVTIAFARWDLQHAHAWAGGRTGLTQALAKLVATEPQRSVALHAMRLLCDEPTLLGSDGALLRLAALGRLSTRDHEMRALALELLSLTAGSVPLDEVASAADEEMPVTLRVAAASAVDVTDATQPRMWRLVLSLLDDDDDDVREAMARRMSHQLAPMRAPLHVALVRQLCWLRCKELKLLTAMLIPEASAIAKAKASLSPQAGQPAYSIFPKDAANFYAEPAVDAAIVAYLNGTSGEVPLGWVDGFERQS